jgi:3-phosphoshikimate 1-carboxyvinyltransferase
MRERPVEDLLIALRQLGVDARSERGNGCPPVLIRSDGLAGGRAVIRGDVSSQFLSGLLMAAPLAKSAVEIEVEGELVSSPYVVMTTNLLHQFGVEVVDEHFRHFRFVGNQAYEWWPDFEVEPDASAASYFFGAAAITGGHFRSSGLFAAEARGRGIHFITGYGQGDVAFLKMLVDMGCTFKSSLLGAGLNGGSLRGIDVDMNAISDTVQTLGAVALFASGPTTIRGVGHIRHKETDRIGALATELRKLGAAVEELSDGLKITPGPLHGAKLNTYQDHRMAMSLALVGLRQKGVIIRDPGCTAKTYPRFFDDLRTLAGGATA